MGILDQIANPMAGQPSGIQNLQVLENLKTRRMQRQQMERQEGVQTQALERQQKGTEAIQQFQDADYKEIISPIETVSSDDIRKGEGLDNLILELTKLNDPRAEFFQKIKEKANETARDETKEQRERSDQLMSMSGGPMAEVADLEDAAAKSQNPQEAAGLIEQAANKFNTIKEQIMAHPVLSKEEDIVSIFDTFGEYQPGTGKFLYLTTMEMDKARGQVQEEKRMAETKRKTKVAETETERHHKKMELAKKQEIALKTMKENKPPEFKSSDATALYKFAVGYHGGMFDDAGNLKMLDPGKTQDVQDLSAFAAIIYSRGKAQTHNEAVSIAAEQLGMSGAGKEPTEEHINMLKSNPDRKADFDELYGTGAADRYLGG